MTIIRRVFLNSTAFGLGVALLYWSTTKENVGTVLLALFGTAFAFVFAYLWFTRNEVHVDGDEARAPRDLAGESIGVFSLESKWPLITACATAMLLVGVVLHPMLVPLAALVFFWSVWGLIRENV